MVEVRWNQIDTPSRITAILSWNVPYAAAVHEGATFKSGTEMPSRPWVIYSAEEYDFLSQYKYNFIHNSYNFRQAFINVANEFGEVCQESIRSPVWQWNRLTVRRSGEVVTSPRNIVDLGNLLASYSLEIN
jgi:hypothetical protein